MVRREALSRIRDASVRLELGGKDPDEVIRLEASTERGDQKTLEEFALKSRNPEVRRKAAEHLEDQHILETVARGDQSPEVRKAARMRITDPALLAELAMLEGTPEERIEALRKLPSDSGLLLDAAAGDRDPAVAVFAAERLEDRERIRKTALGTVWPQAALAAVRKLEDREDLLSVMGRAALMEPALERLKALGLLQEDEKGRTDLELLERFFRENLARSGQKKILKAYDAEDVETLESLLSEESVAAALLLLRKHPTDVDSYYSETEPSRTASWVFNMFKRAYRAHPELRGSIAAAQPYSVRTHLDHGGSSCHEDRGPLIFDF